MTERFKIGVPWKPTPNSVRSFLDSEFSGFTAQAPEPWRISGMSPKWTASLQQVVNPVGSVIEWGKAARDVVNSGDLVNNSSGDDRADLALKARYDAYDKADALNWLMEGSEPAIEEGFAADVMPAPGSGVHPSQIGPFDQTAFKEAHFGKPPEAPVREFIERRSEGSDFTLLDYLKSTASNFVNPLGVVTGIASDLGADIGVKDVLLGAGELPRQTVGGLRDAVQNTDEVISWFDEYGADLPPGRKMTKAAWKRLGITQLPEVGQPYTVVGSVVRSIAQFLAPFGVVSKAFGGLRAPIRESCAVSNDYLIQLYGNCLGEAFPDGSMFVADPAAEIPPLGLCHVVLREGDWARSMREGWPEFRDEPVVAMGKLFLDRGIRGGREVVLIAQFYPPTIAVIAVDDVEAMHRIVGEANRNIKEWEAASEMFNLVAWARGTEATEPINPDWRPTAQRGRGEALYKLSASAQCGENATEPRKVRPPSQESCGNPILASKL